MKSVTIAYSPMGIFNIFHTVLVIQCLVGSYVSHGNCFEKLSWTFFKTFCVGAFQTHCILLQKCEKHLENCYGTSEGMLLELVDRFWHRWLCAHFNGIIRDFLLEIKLCTIDGELLKAVRWNFRGHVCIHKHTIQSHPYISTCKLMFCCEGFCAGVIRDSGFFGMWCCVSGSWTLNPGRWRQYVPSKSWYHLHSDAMLRPIRLISWYFFSNFFAVF
jgi:hypothetical protein